MSSSIRRCAPPRSSSTSPAPSRARAPSSPTCSPRSPPRCWERRSCVWRERAAAFAPGRVNLIGEHTDYNQGLALPFAIAEGVVVRAETADPDPSGAQRIYAHARDLGESDEFPLADVPRAEGWRAFVRGTAAELLKAGYPIPGARLEIGGDLEQGAGLSSSAALEVALCLTLMDLAPVAPLHRIAIARLCARVEND